MNKSFCLVLSLLEINKIVIVMYVFWYDYVKPKYGEKVMLRWYSLIVHIKTEEVYKDISNDVETASDYSNYELERALPGGKNWKVIGLMKNEIGEKLITEFSEVISENI